ncbi:MAG TPA: ATP-binding protein [Flavipsychrobacter sp.]|nr:ATP-binding protein [Flavipsychrobacter sp.]
MIFELKHTNAAANLQSAIDNCRTIISERLKAHFTDTALDLEQWMKDQFDTSLISGALQSAIPFLKSNDEWFAVMVALMPHIYPSLFESVILEHLPNGGDFPEFGGVKATNHRGMLPTGETVQFILGGNDIDKRLQLQQLFREEHFFYRNGILWLEPVKEGEPIMSGRIVLAQEWVEKLLFGKESAPRFGLDFPAKQIVTSMEWEDVVLHPRTLHQIKDISIWLEHHHKLSLDDNLKKKVKPGYRVLFYGPSGTGKTLTAALLGKEFKKDVYRIDLSQIVSKYIGETEKNLEGVFKKAETKDWVLFFDEADALFGKRTNVQSAHDKYANQEVSYLLQRVEDYPGLLILASNFKNNLDDAFLRRFHAVVHFPMPNAFERATLWQKSLPSNLQYHTSINLKELAEQFELTGASILNAVQYATLQCYARNDGILLQTDLMDGIKKEFLKEEKSF